MSTLFGGLPCQLFLFQCAKAFCRSIGLPHSLVLAGLIGVTGMAVPPSGKAASTPGTLVLTEVMAVSQSAVADDDGEYPDWIELFNPSGTAVDLTGWHLTDARSRPTKWSFPSTTLGSGQFLVVFASGKDRRAPDKPLHTSFSLSAEGEYLALVAPDGVSVISELTFPAQRFGYSYGLADGAVGGADQGVFFDRPTPGGPNGLGYAGFARKPEASVQRGFYEQPFAVTLDNHTPGSAVLYTLNGTEPRPAPGVAVSVSPADVSEAGDGISAFSRVYPNGTAVTLTAPTVDGGFLFQRWLRNGEAFSTSPAVNVILDSDCVMNAVYAPGPLAPGKVPESAPYTLVYSLSLPDRADYSRAPVPYELDNRMQIGAFTRVAYYMEIQVQGDSSSHYLWASMNAFTTDTGKLGVPTLASGAFFQQAVENLSVRSSLPEIVAGDDLPGGYLEFWPGNYLEENEAGVPGASSTAYDFGDLAGPREQIGYGSMQLHNTVAGQTLFAFNGWGGILSTDADVGIGSSAGPHPDWTFAANAPKLAVKRLQVYVLEPDRSAAITPGTSAEIQALTSQSVAATVQPELRSLMVLVSNPESGFAYSDPIEINTTRTLRAASVGPNTYPSEVTTETYLFLEDVLRQPASVPGYPNPEMQLYMFEGSQMVQRPVRLDYEMDPDIVNAPAYRDTIRAAMRSIPSLSLVGRADQFFGHEGVYYGVGASGGPEIPVSVELIYPEEPNRNLQVNAGLVPHSWAELKRAFRIMLRNDYGSPELETDLFRNAPWNGPTTTDRFRRVVLRAGTNRSFATFWNPDDTCYTRDEWARASQAAMSGQAAHGNFVHLFINGLYWGLYNPVERPDHFFAASYFGGSDEDYFVANHGGPVSGDPSRWTYLTQEVIRKNMATPANYEELKTHVDLQQFCDYLLLNWYSGTADWPENNWYASMRLTPSPTPLRFFVWDAEDIWDAEGSSGPFDLDCTGCIKRGSDGAWIPSDFVQANSSGTGPVIAQLFHAARANPEFLTLLADRAYHHLQAGGALSDAQSQARWTQINEFVREAVIGESARWGDARDTLPGEAGVLRDRDGVWEPEYLRVLNESIPGNAARMIAVLRAEGYYPVVDPPQFSVAGGLIAPGQSLAISSSPGAVYYTLDGSDPRDAGGALASGALAYAEPLTLSADTRIKARLLDGQTWSALAEAHYFVGQAPPLRVTEIMFNPPALTADEISAGFNDNEQFEFLELQNVGPDSVNLADVQFTEGIRYAFGPVDLAPGEVLVLANNPAALAVRYGTGFRVVGPYEGNLSNGGETLRWMDGAGRVVQEFTYSDGWHPATDGDGHSLVVRDAQAPAEAWGQASHWSASRTSGGSPGRIEGSSNDSFAVWRNLFFAPGDPSGDPSADPDGDGLSNLAEYAYDRHPLQPEPVGPVALSLTESGEGTLHLELSFKRRVSSNDLTYLLEVSEDAKEWRTESGSFVEIGGLRMASGSSEQVTLRLLPSIEAFAKRFIRIGIRLSSP